MIRQKFLDKFLLVFLQWDVVGVSAEDVLEERFELVDIVIFLASEFELVDLLVFGCVLLLLLDLFLVAFFQVLQDCVVMIAMFFPKLVQIITFSLLDSQLCISDLQTLFFEFGNDFGLGIFLIQCKVTLRLVESDIRWKNIVSFQQCLLNILEWHGFLFFNSEDENDWLNLFVRVLGEIILFWFEFLLGLEFRKIIKGYSFDHGLISVEFETVISSNCVNDLLDLADTQLLDLVTVQE